MNNLLDDIANLTNVSKLSLEKLLECAKLSISHSVFEARIDNNTLVEMDIGLGILYIKYDEAEIKYKFIPHKDLEEEVAATIRTKKSPIITKLDTSLKERIENAYKDLL